MIDRNLKPKLAKDIVWKEEGENGEIISLASYIGGPIRMLNPVASKIIKLLDGKHTVKEIINEIVESFEDVDYDTAEKDVLEFLEELKQKRIID
jgi:methyltransferase-like protein